MWFRHWSEAEEKKPGWLASRTGLEETPAPIPAKLYRVLPAIGTSKFIVSFHDGASKNSDGSPFWDLAVCRNKTNHDAFVRGLEAKGYQPE